MSNVLSFPANKKMQVESECKALVEAGQLTPEVIDGYMQVIAGVMNNMKYLNEQDKENALWVSFDIVLKLVKNYKQKENL